MPNTELTNGADSLIDSALVHQAYEPGSIPTTVLYLETKFCDFPTVPYHKVSIKYIQFDF